MKNIEMKEFGKLNDSTSAMVYTLKNAAGMSVDITNSMICDESNDTLYSKLQ